MAVGNVSYRVYDLTGFNLLKMFKTFETNRGQHSLNELMAGENLQNDYNRIPMQGCVQSCLGRNIDLYA